MLTAHINFYVFRNIPTDEIIGRELAKFAKQQNFKKMFIVFERESYGKRLAEFFREEAETKQGITISATRSYHEKEKNLRSLWIGTENLKFDAILVAGGVNQATKLIRQARMMGIIQPFIGGDSLDSKKLIELKYDAMGTFVASVFNPNLNKQSKQFVRNFKENNDGKEPDAKAAQGYDAVKVLARAIENSKSTATMDIAMALRYMEGWKGVVGSYEFLANGNISGRGIHVKRLAAGDKFKFQ
jgi:branched-chain amino acid transport system substrate-binding protein